MSSTSAITIVDTVYDNNLIAVLPKFEVTLSGSNQLERDDNHFDVTVEAKYTFGEDVDGRVKINATLMSSTREESFVIYERTANLVWIQAKYDLSDPHKIHLMWKLLQFLVLHLI